MLVVGIDLHTSKRMHFIEDAVAIVVGSAPMLLHTSKRMHFIEEWNIAQSLQAHKPCIRQNVCTSLRRAQIMDDNDKQMTLHTSKRMHFIEDMGR